MESSIINNPFDQIFVVIIIGVLLYIALSKSKGDDSFDNMEFD